MLGEESKRTTLHGLEGSDMRDRKRCEGRERRRARVEAGGSLRCKSASEVGRHGSGACAEWEPFGPDLERSEGLCEPRES